MNFDHDVIAIGLIAFEGKTKLVEIKSPRELKGRTLDQVIFVQDVDDTIWFQSAKYATAHSTVEHPISQLA